jgi:hypothetical protein
MNNNKYFKKKFEWNEQTKNFLGVPRPYVKVPINFSIETLRDFILPKKIPIPWQSKPILNTKGTVFNVISENEKKIYPENLCGYCGIKIDNSELCIRWIGSDTKENPNMDKGPRVFSDTHPLHIQCMEQARIFCPYLRKRNSLEFENGIFFTLKQNALKYKKMFE